MRKQRNPSSVRRYRDILAAIANGATNERLPFLAKAIAGFLLERSEAEHARWDSKTREPAAETVLSSLKKQANDQEELDESASRALRDLSTISYKVPHLKDTDEQILALRELSHVEIARSRITARQPCDILWGVLRLLSDETVIRVFFSRSAHLRLRDDKDWRCFRKDQLVPLWRVLKTTAREYGEDAIWQSCAIASRVYRCRVERLDAEDVYTQAHAFHFNCGGGRSVIFSLTSDAVNPLERRGSGWFVQRYGVDPNDESLRDLMLKNPFRPDNFGRGILNGSVPGERLFTWELNSTAKALQTAYNAVPREKRDLFVKDAVENLKECFEFPKIRILEVEKFENWMKRLTRNGPDSVMVSFRGADSRRICHAVNVDFSKSARMHQLWQLVFGVASASSMACTPSSALAILWASAIGFENVMYEELRSQVFQKGFDWKQATALGVREVKPFGSMGLTARQSRELAEWHVHRLLTWKSARGG